MDFSRLQLAGPQGKDLENELHTFTKRLPRGVIKGPLRIENVSANFDTLSVEAAYQLMNPAEFEREVEEVRLKNIGRIGGPIFWRNLFSILPLIATWVALFLAALGYAADPRRTYVPNNATQPTSFFILWQDGFGGRTPQFRDIAALDVILLVGFLIFTLWVQIRENRAQEAAIRFSAEFQGVATKLISLVANQGAVQVAPGADPKTVAEAVNRAIQRALDASKQVTDQAQQALADMHQQVQGLVTNMTTKIDAVQQQMQGMATAGTQLGTAAGTLATSANALASTSNQYMQAGQVVQQQIQALNANEAALVQQLQGVGGSVSGAAQMLNTALTATNDLAATIRQDMGTGVQQMTGTITDSAKVLGSTETQLRQTGGQLDIVTQQLIQAGKIMQDAAQQFQQVLLTSGLTPPRQQPIQQKKGPTNLLDWLFRR